MARRFDRSPSHLPLPVVGLDARGRIVLWNRAAAKLSGYLDRDLAGTGWRKLFVTPAARRAWLAERRNRLSGGTAPWTWPMHTRRGEPCIVRWQTWPGATVPGVHWLALGEDITDWQSQRSQLESASQFLRIAQATARFGAWSYDPRSQSVDFTPELEAIYGVTAGRFGRRYVDFGARVVAEDLQRIESIRDRAVARREPFEYDIRVRADDGGIRWINVRGRGIYAADGTLQKIVGIDTDVTALRATETALSKSNAYLETILRSPDVVMFRQDRTLRYTDVMNPALGALAEEILGRTDEEVSGRSGATQLTPPKRRVLRTGRGERVQVDVERGGHAGCYDLIIEPDRDESGRVIGVVCAALDITARRNAQRALEEANRRLSDLAVHLQESIEAERKAVARDVHDQVGATLTAVRMRLTTLAGRTPPEQPLQRAELLSIAALVESAMHATRDICGRLRPPALEDMGLAETCRWYVRDWSASTGIRTRGRFPPQECHCHSAAATDLFRILQELLTNVARHSGARLVQVSLSCAGRRLRLRVRDDGHGFDTSVPVQGFGLAGVRERARHHGGRVEIRSTPHGTAIDVIIPSGGAP